MYILLGNLPKCRFFSTLYTVRESTIRSWDLQYYMTLVHIGTMLFLSTINQSNSKYFCLIDNIILFLNIWRTLFVWNRINATGIPKIRIIWIKKILNIELESSKSKTQLFNTILYIFSEQKQLIRFGTTLSTFFFSNIA